MRQFGGTDLKRLHRSWNRRTQHRVSLLLEDVQSPWNVGSIARVAAAFRISHVYMVGATAPMNNPKAGKVSLGTDKYLTWTKVEEATSAVELAHEEGYRVIGLELADGAVPLMECRLNGDVCLALGNEDRGLSSSCLDQCDEVGYIPQLGRVGSLNVAAATGIAIYEARRQGWVAERSSE